ncbi:ABC transporter permease [Nocardioides nematodiphilus]|uniref:ABC transporter permease n=1 Tax=Nocardioides nematodiphilus TaxID=2849669 RepID=UPI001CD94450|nr:ABC transporter permease [Nocardioides nematodiphilus]MCA1983278.1 ABC transporter permease [Nocardioides nematodiphilus]
MTSATVTGAPPAARTYRAYSHSWWRRTLLTREVAIIALLVLVFGWASANVANFKSPLTIYFLSLDNAEIMLIALPMALVIITGEIDLSVASVVGLSSVTVGLLHQDAGLSIPLAGLIAILVGVVAGALNGFLIAYVGLPSLAVTIGTMAAYRGLAVGLLGTTAKTDFPLKWTDLSTQHIGSTRFPVIVLPILVLIAVFVWLLHFSTFGRGVFEIGLNDEAAHFSGVNVARTKFILFILTAAISAFAGIYITLRSGNARGDNATGDELKVIAAVLLGGVSIFGGRGALHGVIAGVLLIGVIQSAMRLQNETVNVINIVIGALLVLSVMSTSILAWLSKQRARRAGLGTLRRRQAVATSHPER